MINKGIVRIPPCIGNMENIGMRKVDGDIGIRMGRWVILQVDLYAIEFQDVLVFENNSRKRSPWHRGKGIVPIHDTNGLHQVRSCFLMTNDRYAFIMYPLIPIGMIEVPMRIDEVL